MMGLGVVNKSWKKAAILAGLSSSALMTGAAWAQPTAGGAPEEIIVTAQRRAERLQDVPISITAATGETLERAAVTNVRDLSSIAAGVVTSGQGANIVPAIRGVSSAQTDPGNDANVSLYIDGVYQADQLTNAMELPDVERVEILKGPQGTLFGRNATGGAIRIFTRGPSMDKTTGMLDVGYGKYDHLSLKGFLSAPIVEGKLAASVSASYDTENAYTFNIVTNRKGEDTVSKSARVRILATPSDTLSLELFGSYAYRTCGDCVSFQAYRGNTSARTFPGAIIPQAKNVYAANGEAQVKGQVYTGGLRATLETGIGDLVSTSAYNAVKSYYYNEEDGSNIDVSSYPIYKRQNTFSEELLFTSKKFGDFQGIAGFYYYGDTARYDPLALQGLIFGGLLYGYSKQRTDAYSGFGELTYEPTDRITLIAGARYNHEEREAAAAGFGLPGPRPPESAFTPLGSPVAFNSFTPRASIRYRLSDAGDNAYFTFSQGFKSGGFNIAGLQAAPFKPEKLTAYEIGLKTAPSRTLSANLAAFYYDYTNQQVMAAVNGLNQTSNAASSRIYGADADVTARVTDEFTVTAGISLLDAKYTNYPTAVANNPILNPDGSNCLCGYLTGTRNLNGHRQPMSPTFTLNVGAEYRKELAAGTLDLSANLFHTAKYSFQSYANVYNPAYTTLALRASFQPTNSNFTFYAWGKNITSARYFIAMLDGNTGDFVAYSRPASFGGGVKYAF